MSGRPAKLRLVVTLAALILISALETCFVSEATGIAEAVRKPLYVVFLAATAAVGYVYWRRSVHPWMWRMWLLVYGFGLAVLVVTNIIQWQWAVLSEDLLDQIRYFRIFFTSPCVFLISAALGQMGMQDGRVDKGK